MALQLTTQQLEYLVSIERAGTWAEAAEGVGVTPSALSQGIGELERRLGLALFERAGRRRVPTPNHGHVLRYAETVLGATVELDRWADRRRRGESGEVRLGMIDTAATHHFRDVLLGYRRTRPDVDLRLRVSPSADLLLRLARAELDVVVCVGSPRPIAGIDQQVLLQDPLAVLAPTDRATNRIEDWHPWVSFPVGSHTRDRIAETLRSRGARFEVVAESHQPDVLQEMVRLGIGWTVLPIAQSAVAPGISVVEPAITTRTLVLARRTGAPTDPAVDQLSAMLLSGQRTAEESR